MRDDQRASKLVRVVASLNELVGDHDSLDCAAIVAESSVEESILVGSAGALMRLASELLRVVAAFEGAGKQLEDGGVVDRGEKMSGDIKFLFDENATVWPVCLCITPSSEVTDLVRKELDS